MGVIRRYNARIVCFCNNSLVFARFLRILVWVITETGVYIEQYYTRSDSTR